jgi:RNA polymerase sigma factor (TIGR02999 family)
MSSTSVTALLKEWSAGNLQAAEALLPLVYDELRRLARSYMRRERGEHTLQPTALVHEAYLRLVGADGIPWQSRAQFFGIAARQMRRILVEHARERGAQKRGGGAARLSLDEDLEVAAEEKDEVLLALDEALESLNALDPEQAKVVELRYFGGLTVAEIAEGLGVSPRTVDRKWRMGKAYLYDWVAGQGTTDDA